MIPKEKAIELYSAYYNRIEHKLSEEYAPHEKDIVKECALVAVNQILSMGIMSDSGDWRMAKSYWLEVKEEIEKL